MKTLTSAQVQLMVASGWTLVCPSIYDGPLPLRMVRTVDGGAVEQIPFELEDGDEQVDDETESALDPNPEADEPAPEETPAEDPATEAGEPEPEDEPRRDSKGRKLSKRATALEREERIVTIYTTLIRGGSYEDCVNGAKEAGWGVSARQVNDYITEARNRLRELSSYVKAEEFGKALAQLNDLYGNAFNSKDWRMCLSVRQELSDLLGLNEAKPAPAVQINNVKIDVLLNSQAWREIKGALVAEFKDEPILMTRLQGALTKYAAAAERE